MIITDISESIPIAQNTLNEWYILSSYARVQGPAIRVISVTAEMFSESVYAFLRDAFHVWLFQLIGVASEMSDMIIKSWKNGVWATKSMNGPERR